jgi:hypothetical protein
MKLFFVFAILTLVSFSSCQQHVKLNSTALCSMRSANRRANKIAINSAGDIELSFLLRQFF